MQKMRANQEEGRDLIKIIMVLETRGLRNRNAVDSI